MLDSSEDSSISPNDHERRRQRRRHPKPPGSSSRESGKYVLDWQIATEGRRVDQQKTLDMVRTRAATSNDRDVLHHFHAALLIVLGFGGDGLSDSEFSCPRNVYRARLGLVPCVHGRQHAGHDGGAQRLMDSRPTRWGSDWRTADRDLSSREHRLRRPDRGRRTDGITSEFQPRRPPRPGQRPEVAANITPSRTAADEEDCSPCALTPSTRSIRPSSPGFTTTSLIAMSMLAR